MEFNRQKVFAPCPRARGCRHPLTAVMVWMFLLALGGAFSPQGSAALQRFDVFDVFVGYDGIVPENSWFPVVCEIENKGPAFNAVFELGVPYSEEKWRMPIELPTGTRKRFVMPVFSPGLFTRAWEAVLLDERGRKRAEGMVRQVRRNYSRQLPLVGAVSRTSAGRPVFPSVKDQNNQEATIEAARMPPDLFPDNPIALEGLDAIYLSSARATEEQLRAAQVDALVAWLRGGGHLIVAVEQLAQVNGTPWLRRILPVDFSGSTSLTNQGELHEWLRSDARIDGQQYPFREATANPSARPPRADKSRKQSNSKSISNPFSELAKDSDFEGKSINVATGELVDGTVAVEAESTPLVITARRGRGRVTVLTFSPELEPFVTWKQRAFFWAKLANVPAELLPPNRPENRYSGGSVDGVFGAMTESRQIRKLPVGWLLLLLVGYLVVIGPLDRWWLKKINRQMLTWLTFPAYVALFSLLIYFIGYKLRAGESEWNELHVVDVLPLRQEALLRGRTFASIYSPANARYPLECDLPYASLRGEMLRQGRSGREASHASVEQRGNNFVASIFVPVWTSQLYVNDWWTQAPKPFTATVKNHGEGYEVRIENRLEQTLEKARLVLGDQIFNLGEIQAGQSRTFQLPRSGATLQSFVQQQAAFFQEAIRRRQQAFGSNPVEFNDLAASSMAACFLSEFENQGNRYGQFVATPGFELTEQVDQGDAVLLAWVENHSPVKPIYRFSPRRSSRNTLWRTTCEVTY